MSESFDVVVVGMGPSGSTLCCYLADAGLRVLALERTDFPRYRIGESLTGLAGDRIAELGLGEQMKRIGAVDKPGVKVVGSEARADFFVPVQRPTWQVRRSDLDQMLLEAALERGVEVVRGSAKEAIQDGDRVVGVVYESEDGERHEVHARFVADCSGHSAFLSRTGIAGERVSTSFGRQIAVFTQFDGALRDQGALANQTIIFYSKQLHWGWFIPLSETTTSVGVVMPTEVYKSVRGTPEDVMQWGLDNINDDLSRRVVERDPTERVRVIRNYSYRINPFAGKGWLAVGDAHRFADPIFSFGVSMGMTEAKAACQMILGIMSGGEDEAAARAYSHYCETGQNAADDLIRYFWMFPSFFAYQSRGELREQYVRLLAGDLYDQVPLEALRDMRASLDQVPLPPPKLPVAIIEAANFPTEDLPGLRRTGTLDLPDRRAG